MGRSSASDDLFERLILKHFLVEGIVFGFPLFEVKTGIDCSSNESLEKIDSLPSSRPPIKDKLSDEEGGSF